MIPTTPSVHRAGFVNIIGNPNVGKSTLMNALVGERMSIITHKPQTTRHRIVGIVNGDDFQIVFSDTPGKVNMPAYRMHEAMNKFIQGAFEDADLLVLVTEAGEHPERTISMQDDIAQLEIPKVLVINKIDLAKQEDLAALINSYKEAAIFDEIFLLSALHKQGTGGLLREIISRLPEGQPFYPKDQLTDKPERFFVSEIIREKILMHYRDEIPYATEVVVDAFKEEIGKKGPFIRISALIYVMRKTQKSILIGKGGSAIKRIGVESRKDIESFLDAKVHLELYVKVKDNWRDDESALKQFGYKH